MVCCRVYISDRESSLCYLAVAQAQSHVPSEDEQELQNREHKGHQGREQVHLAPRGVEQVGLGFVADP